MPESFFVFAVKDFLPTFKVTEGVLIRTEFTVFIFLTDLHTLHWSYVFFVVVTTSLPETFVSVLGAHLCSVFLMISFFVAPQTEQV